MDKISAMLIAGIISMVIISTAVVADTWIIGRKEIPETCTVIEEVPSEQELTFNDDTSVTNNSDKKLWIRIKVIYYDENNAGDYSIISNALENGEWIYDESGWYYCNRPLRFSETTSPLIDRLLYKNEDISKERGGRFRLQAEAVDQAWLLSDPGTGKEAFRIFNSIAGSYDAAYL